MAEISGQEPAESTDVDVVALVASLVASRRRPSVAELQPLRMKVFRQALRQSHEVPAPPEISGERVGTRPIRTGDPIDVRDAKHIRHAIRQEQWPPGTTFDEYLKSLVDIVDSDESGIFVDRRGDSWVLTFVGRSGNWEGLDGGAYIVVLYDCADRRLLSGFQPSRGLDYVDDNPQVVDGTWLKWLR